jgi:hypothetical protein
MPKAGSSIRQMARERRNGAIVRFGAAAALVIAPVLVYPLLGTTGLSILVYVSCLVGAVVLFEKGQYYWKRANRADQGALGEQTVALLLRDLEGDGWTIEYNIPIPKYGDADAFVHSPSGSCFVVDSKAHGGTVFFNGAKLMRRYGKEVYEFDNDKDLLKAVKGQAVHLKQTKGVKYVTPILCFTKAELDIKAIDNKVQDVHVLYPESLVPLLKRLDSR